MSCGIGCSCGSDPILLWLWCRLMATALILPLAWELPYSTSAALKKNTKKSHYIPILKNNKIDETACFQVNICNVIKDQISFFKLFIRVRTVIILKYSALPEKKKVVVLVLNSLLTSFFLPSIVQSPLECLIWFSSHQEHASKGKMPAEYQEAYCTILTKSQVLWGITDTRH